jgi:FtsP/CotA-like multicopper oxidase with cupredoxin domain
MIDRRGFLVLSAVGVAAGVTGGCSSPPQKPAGSQPVEVAVEPAETEMDLGGVSVRTWAYGAQIPGREIRVRKGQTLRANVTNKLPADTTVHWHGIAVPNDMDGVPVLTQQPIAVGQSFKYEFVVPDTGTYWFHPHIGTQLDRGLYGALIVEDPNERTAYDDELVVVLDDWIDGTGTDPDQVLAKLHKTGMGGMETNESTDVTPTTPLGDDGGDVTYPYFLINGRVRTDPLVVDYRGGQRIRLRVINAGADTAFRVAVPDTMLNITHTDGFPVVPKQTNSVLLGMGERVDATITLNSSVPLIAAAERKDGYAQLNLRVNGAASSVKVDEFVAALRNGAPVDTATLAAAPEVNLPQRDPGKILELRLAGPVNGYTWPINGKLYDSRNNGLAVAKGQRVRIRFISESIMFHPMHVHGHTFQVVQPGGPAARKDTVLVPPMRTVEIDFDTDNPGHWITHCHNDYHLGSGLATFFSYA